LHLGAAILLLSGLTLFLFACEKEIPEHGERIVVDFSVSSADFEAGEEVIRSGNAEEAENEMVSLGDEWYASATLVPAPVEASTEEDLRAAVPLVENQKVCLAAYTFGDGSSTPVSSATYTYIGGQLVADNNQPLGVEPGKYDFVAYSYFKKANEAPATANIHPDKDLVWGNMAGRTISATDRSITIVMYHRFARIKARITLEMGLGMPSVTELTNVKIEGYKYAGLASIRDGSLSDGAALEYLAAIPLNGTRTEPNERLFYSSPTKMTVEKLTVKDLNNSKSYSFANLSIPISSSLSAGRTYTVEVRFKRNPWAFSNIYWDGQKLTFSEASTDPHIDYQGVYFKWGSLIGIAPNGSGTIYVPNVTTYPDGAGTGAGAWSSTSVGSSTWGSYAGIPRQALPSMGTSLMSNDYGNYKGDICAYITNERWRMPARDQFGGGAGYGHTYGNVSVSSSADGKASTGNAYVTYSNVGWTSFPASGHFDGSSFSSAGNGGYYWVNYAEPSAGYFEMSFGTQVNATVVGRGTSYLNGANPVRCTR
jgi:hypothetical protein